MLTTLRQLGGGACERGVRSTFTQVGNAPKSHLLFNFFTQREMRGDGKGIFELDTPIHHRSYAMRLGEALAVGRAE